MQLVLLLWSYIRVVLKDPGSVPENWRAVSGEESLEVGTSLAAAEDGFERRSRGGVYCIHCQNWKPPRCHHCSICMSNLNLIVRFWIYYIHLRQNLVIM